MCLCKCSYLHEEVLRRSDDKLVCLSLPCTLFQTGSLCNSATMHAKLGGKQIPRDLPVSTTNVSLGELGLKMLMVYVQLLLGL